ncbi:tRNA (adenosine(37)-N6)-dimethylallyltransferase MiaA [Candidatus Woesebacteria bacterium RIFCSPHIGHO2_01_FULL_44_10]|uniref:tRNA dimethylallyltransferase n=1 Tax=Candidatus Woesebacteria bacterium RIFCSPLOWO2_01_FULL_44_14 TaxID=1802525 RepID=A0A1F8C1T6_9BACT|nr:MAG: tRNA (adenosine(37)-N6)-dimethylallyltransferase MiaA [Candidatus Woesebacteria bacterium RIFCSPHIGHO2_01_FULL_44_10]OGM54321.1 MAG: tRNA (adenosine(37)-N6)-dimethylallyltransferase MiaA [Candidatus Woesebacteria bacterium RIFCSPHIGHO2_12_FULL_44_11]OGM70222.1 MAG: tRNA (adenosine(37)-N6)-dimethylallyltransferase MiaA [Candidatus Woesebacteria bacterium RIFCSPLOWO2_01_FULL_44_14]
MNKLFVVCGPTATGKTELALNLAKKFSGVLVSADSRQVYRQMDIGTGKDKHKTGNILGYDLVSPRDEFSVAAYVKFARRAVRQIWRQKKLPILVGGTGFYIKGVVDGIGTSSVPRNLNLRKSLEKKSAEELFEILSAEDPIKAASMNQSDRKNPRRLIRAIEVARKVLSIKYQVLSIKADVLFVGLKADKKVLDERIEKRVQQRLSQGFEKEVKNLLKSGVRWEDQSMQSLGYRQYKDYFEGKVDKQIFVRKWESEEQKYAKRQMVWFKRNRRINWFDISKRGWQKKVEKLVKKWHN